MHLDLRANLESTKAAALADIDRQAEEIRLNFITPGAGQAMTYSEKRLEAERYTANPSIDESEIPHIVAEAELNAVSIAEQAARVLAMAQLWRAASVEIETIRMAAKNAVRSAGNVAAVRAAKAIDWSGILSLLET